VVANPQDFAYFSRGESPPWNKGTGATTGFDYFNRLESYPAVIIGGVAQALAGTTAGSSTVSGGLAVAHSIGGTTAGTSTVSASLAVTHSLAGTTAGSSTATADLILALPLAGMTAGTSTATGDLSGGSIPTAAIPGGGYAVRPTYQQPVRIRGRAKKRLTVTVLTWGAVATGRTQHILAAAALTTGEGATRTTTHVGGDLSTRHGHAAATSRADLQTHLGDPREDDDLILAGLALILSPPRVGPAQAHSSRGGEHVR
jgi:hypothetical protein